jgi:hypothetical protein
MDMCCLPLVNKRAAVVFAIGEEANQLDGCVGQIEEHFRIIVGLVSQVLCFTLKVLDVVAGAQSGCVNEKCRAGIWGQGSFQKRSEVGFADNVGGYADGAPSRDKSVDEKNGLDRRVERDGCAFRFHFACECLSIDNGDLPFEVCEGTKRVYVRLFEHIVQCDVWADVVCHEHSPHFANDTNFGRRRDCRNECDDESDGTNSAVAHSEVEGHGEFVASHNSRQIQCGRARMAPAEHLPPPARAGRV